MERKPSGIFCSCFSDATFECATITTTTVQLEKRESKLTKEPRLWWRTWRAKFFHGNSWLFPSKIPVQENPFGVKYFKATLTQKALRRIVDFWTSAILLAALQDELKCFHCSLHINNTQTMYKIYIKIFPLTKSIY